MKSFIVELLGNCWGFLTGLLMIIGTITGWIFFEVLQKVDAEDVKRGLSWTILIAFLSLGFVGVGYYIGGLFDWESSLYADRIPQTFLGSISQIILLLAILFLSKKMEKAHMLHGDLGGVMSALLVAFFIVGILGVCGLIVSCWWLIAN